MRCFQDALIKIVKDAKKTGLSRAEVGIMWEWTEEVGLSGLICGRQMEF